MKPQACSSVPPSTSARATSNVRPQLLCGAAFARSMAGDVPGGVATATAAVRTGEEAGGASLAGAQLTLGWTLILAGRGSSRVPAAAGGGATTPRRRFPPETRAMIGSDRDVDGGLRDGTCGAGAGGRPGARGRLRGRSAARARARWRSSCSGTANGPPSRRLADEAVRLASDLGQDFHWARIQLAQLDAVTGDTDGARAHAAVILAFALQSGSRSLEIYASAALGLLELGLDAPARAAEHLERTEALVERSGLGEPNVVQWRADLVESQCRAGRADDAAPEPGDVPARGGCDRPPLGPRRRGPLPRAARSGRRHRPALRRCPPARRRRAVAVRARSHRTLLGGTAAPRAPSRRGPPSPGRSAGALPGARRRSVGRQGRARAGLQRRPRHAAARERRRRQ